MEVRREGVLEIQPPPALSPHQDGPTILVAEDDVLVRMAVADELRRAGFRVIEAGNAEEALTALRSGAHVDLLFTDIRMPGAMDGIALATTVEAEFPDVVLAVGSGEQLSEIPSSVRLSVRKPYAFNELVRALARLLQREQSGGTID